MKKRNKKGMRDITKDNSQDKYSYKGFTFKFDDKGLQEEYVETYEKYKYLELNLPTSQVGRIDAVAFSRGKNFKRLEKISERYDDKSDANYDRGSKHKFDMFDKIRDRYNTQYNRQMIKLEEYFDLVEEETKIFNKKHSKGKLSNGKTLRYNVVWYSKMKEGTSVGI